MMDALLFLASCALSLVAIICALAFQVQSRRHIRRLPYAEWQLRHRVRLLCRQSYPSVQWKEWHHV